MCGWVGGRGQWEREAAHPGLSLRPAPEVTSRVGVGGAESPLQAAGSVAASCPNRVAAVASHSATLSSHAFPVRFSGGGRAGGVSAAKVEVQP